MHFDVPTKPSVLKIINILNMYNIFQDVAMPMHRLGDIKDMSWSTEEI